MMIYGSYLSKDEHLPSIGATVTMIDVSVAFVAGLLVLPAMYVANHQGVQIFAADGSLLREDTLVFAVIPALFNSMGFIGQILALTFFGLLAIAAITSAVSLLEVPVSYVVENTRFKRSQARRLSENRV